MAVDMNQDELVARLVRAGELERSGENQTEAESYFATEEIPIPRARRLRVRLRRTRQHKRPLVTPRGSRCRTPLVGFAR